MSDPGPPPASRDNDAALQSRVTKMQETVKWVREAEAAAVAARRFAEAIIETVREPLLILSSDFRVVSANRAYYAMFGVRPEETLGRYIFELGDRQWDLPELRRLLSEILRRDSRFDDFLVDHVFPGIGRRIILLNACRVRESREEQETILLALEDITARRRAEELLLVAAVTDPLTGLLNRRGLFERLKGLVARGHEIRRSFHLLFVDLDGLKTINDRLGHEEGDRALMDAAAILRATFPEAEAVARVGGDEFVVAPVGTAEEDASSEIARLREAVEAHNRGAGRAYALSMSAGTADWEPAGDADIGRLIARGDTAMYAVKRERRRE